ncbi:transposase [Shewanella sairae]|uniref:Transposase n=1 Tax=Shewanella sairae TaxID=190310 RepID=A0ABQ4PFR3_9GAMM|nr:site-specific integrase [Shewanella sairae]MCL1130034.1 site-specific integrase [Shewanella sairae]GIU46244.1 transposase [Shewanella sairae]
MHLKIEKITVNGEQSVFYTDGFGYPISGNLSVDYASNYICLEKSSTTIKSRETTARHLLFCLNYFIYNDIDIVNRVASGEFFSFFELDKFSNHCFLKQRIINKTKSSNIVSFTPKDSISPSTRKTTCRQNQVSNTTARERLRALRSYLEYLYERFYGFNSPTRLKEHYDNVIRHLNREVNKAKPNNTSVIDIDEEVFTQEVIDKIFEITLVGHPSNPFKRSQLRNRVIIDTIFDIGIRRGALLNLKLGDIKDEETPRLDIINRINFDDPRKHRPTQKTQSGVIGTQFSTIRNLKTYIETVRDSYTSTTKPSPLYPKALEHDFIFISEYGTTKGHPLSITGFNYIFDVLSEAVGVNIHPHLIRHHWNYNFTRQAEKAGLTSHETDKLRKHQMTWSENSTMCSGQVKLDTDLYVFQNLRSDSFGVKPPL